MEAHYREGAVEAFVCLANILKEASAVVEDDPVTAKACIARAGVLLREVQARHAPEANAQAAPLTGLGLARWQLNRVMLHLEANLEDSLRVRDLARLAGLSPGHFARAFRRSIGMSPRSFMIEQRVERAKKLMLTTGLPLSEIALACGLSDQAHLSRIFRRHTGVSPHAWRRQLRDVESTDARQAAGGH
ncbi:helix-turn-helix domain-containing protein [Rhodopseudomonas sp. NSM]|uniref:helix-turn-helix domain-containing protein n=1 Tax=Rhodopseudomonas sp. NSM TaxID=3457630 RepID=UPI004036CC72